MLIMNVENLSTAGNFRLTEYKDKETQDSTFCPFFSTLIKAVFDFLP